MGRKSLMAVLSLTGLAATAAPASAISDERACTEVRRP